MLWLVCGYVPPFHIKKTLLHSFYSVYRLDPLFKEHVRYSGSHVFAEAIVSMGWQNLIRDECDILNTGTQRPRFEQNYLTDLH